MKKVSKLVELSSDEANQVSGGISNEQRHAFEAIIDAVVPSWVGQVFGAEDLGGGDTPNSSGRDVRYGNPMEGTLPNA